MSTGSRSELTAGTVVDGYRIERVLGAGGFGITYLAVEVESSRKVAVKEYFPASLAQRGAAETGLRPLADDAEAFRFGLERFRREAQMLIHLNHPSVVRALRLSSANGTAYLAMDYLEGETLAAVLSRAGTLPEETLFALLPPLLDALAAVHRAGALHCDLSPAHIFVRAGDGQPLLIDFGAARFELQRASKTLASIVTPGYAPFEQFSTDQELGPATDIYALGASLYRCVTGARPVSAPDRLARAGYNLLIPAAVAAKGRFPPALLAAIDAALAITPAERPQSVEEFRALAFARADIAAGPVPAQRKQGKHQVFISYASPDKATAALVCGALEDAGIKCWIAPRDTEAGAYSKSILEGIRNARMLVLILSPHSDRSPNVLSEVAEAFDRKLALLPFRLSEFEVSDDLRFFIRTQHWVDGFPKPAERHLPALVARAKARLDQGGAMPAPEPAQTAANAAPAPGAGAAPGAQRGGRRRLIAAGTLATLALVAVGAYFAMQPTRGSGTAAAPPPVTPPTVAAPKGPFRDCAECPEMLVMPAGRFTMGSPPGEREREANEGPQRQVTIAKPFALGKHAVTFEEYDACVAAGGCGHRPADNGWGRGRQPVVQVSWDDAKAYAAWLAKKTGRAYRLPSEAEWEYAARAGTTTRYFWGDEIGRGHAACAGCGTQWDGKQPPPVGSFAANPWGLHDLHGAVWQWVEDCWHESYRDAPADGRAWVSGDCKRRALRGGAFFSYPKSLRSAYRYAYEPKGRLGNIGFRVARDIE